MACDSAHVRAYLPRATWLPSLGCDGARLHQFYKRIFSNNNQLVNIDGCENAGGACDGVKLRLRLKGMMSDNKVFAVLLLVWLRHTVK